MKGKGAGVALALVLAVGATVAVFAYVRSVRSGTEVTDTVDVIVAQEDIPAGARLDTLISSGGFTTVAVPRDAIVGGAITTFDQLRGHTTSTAIFAGEQMSTARLQGATDQSGGRLGLREGYVAVGLQLPAPQAGLGFIQEGDHVIVFNTFSQALLINRPQGEIVGGPLATVENNLNYTQTVVPDARVLKVLTSGATSVSGGTTEDISLELEVTPRDAQRLLHAHEKGEVWLALLRPDEEGTDRKPVNAGSILVEHERERAAA